MTSTERDRTASQVLADGFTLDLRDRPTRADLGLDEGQSRAVTNLDGEKQFDAEVTFDDGTQLSTPANVLFAEAYGGERPTLVELLRHDVTEAELQAALDLAVSRFGARPDDIAGVMAKVTSRREVLFKRTIRTELPGPDKLALLVVSDDNGQQLTWQIQLGE